ncbi:MAG: SurA N-terminal domain-containing protein [Prevotellaceae bacterium]|nr:SurA N-terminal domain-containing protein [Prevotellaceae bacterium]
MATLQKIRSKGALLVIVIGLALFAFIAGDAWKVLQPHRSQDIGVVAGEKLSAQDYQALVEEYSEVVKFSSGLTSLTEEQTNSIKDQVWQNYVNNKLIENEAKKLGLEVSDAEIEAIIDAGSHPMLQQTPFRNPQTGTFDKDMLKKFLVDYAKMGKSAAASQYADYYNTVYKYWSFIEKTLMQTRLQEKYQALITKSLLSNPVEAQNSFNSRIDQTDLLLAAIPYSSVPDSTVGVRQSDIRAAYDKKKEQYRQLAETRDIKYIDVQVTASQADHDAIEQEVEEYTSQLDETDSDYASFIRSTGSTSPYVDLFYTAKALPSDVVARLDSVAVGGIYGPYYNAVDNTINSFKKIAVATMADSIEFRQIQVVADDASSTQLLADSIYNAIKGGADFAEVAKLYGQTGDTGWLTSANYEGAQVDGDNLKYLSTLIDMAPKELVNLSLGQVSLIMQVTDKRAMQEKYKVAVVKRPVEFSKETYSKAYNDFSQFIATNNTLEKITANAEDAGYKLLDRKELYNSEHTIGGVAGTKELLRWIFGAKTGEVSGLYECGESDHLMAAAVAGITKEGYRPVESVKDELFVEVMRDKKAEKIMADLQAAGTTTLDAIQGMAGAVGDSIKHVTFAAPAYVSVLHSSEPAISAYAAVAGVNQSSAPIKGNGGVYVLQPYSQEKLEGEYDEAGEKSSLEATYMRMAGQFINDLYISAKVKDKRYLYF